MTENSRTTKAAKIRRVLKTYTHEDAALSHLGDPLQGYQTEDPTDLFEQDFFNRLARDHEYWEQRHRQALGIPDMPTGHDPVTTTTDDLKLDSEPKPTPKPTLARKPPAIFVALYNALASVLPLPTITYGDQHGNTNAGPTKPHYGRLQGHQVRDVCTRIHRRKASRHRKGNPAK